MVELYLCNVSDHLYIFNISIVSWKHLSCDHEIIIRKLCPLTNQKTVKVTMMIFQK